MWMYGAEIWGTTSSSNLKHLERFHNKFMTVVTNALWYVKNERLRADLNLTPVEEIIRQ